ncbi:cytochrome P450 [Schizopora paradoxa]|uniref:Cytochrome P450 n=1 Tax=Schizopora paradoxa TaxID=27342 RepID=A0A0H2SKQ9_9AGAM|nr:cytochrome P450 [Schizopora paradoxa]
MPRKNEWETITKWGKQYGDVVRVTVLGKDLIFLNTAKAANDLFERRSSIYSDRPRLPLINELMGHDWNFGFMPYGDEWRRHRKVFVSKFGPGNVHIFNPIQERAVAQLLDRMLCTPKDFLDHLRLHAGQLIMMSVYGIPVQSREDRYISVAQAVMDAVSDAAKPGAWLVDMFPILKHLPAWFPGAYYKKVAKQWSSDVNELRKAPFGVAKSLMLKGLPAPSFVSELLEEMKDPKDEEEAIVRDCAALAYGAGSDTSVSTLSAFMLAMVLFPEVQKKAQAEVDSIVGSQRLPTFADKEDMPYVFAVMKETLRWHSVAPQGLPHQLREDDVYNGYRIPAGSIVVGNTWGILHDPDVYPEPMSFKPERYLNSEGKLDYVAIDPARYSFGYGRRICAGVHYAENTLWITIAQLLATFDIRHAIDKHGRLIEAKLEARSGIISHPAPFECSITPRSEQTKQLVEQANAKLVW